MKVKRHKKPIDPEDNVMVFFLVFGTLLIAALINLIIRML